MDGHSLTALELSGVSHACAGEPVPPDFDRSRPGLLWPQEHGGGLLL